MLSSESSPRPFFCFAFFLCSVMTYDSERHPICCDLLALIRFCFHSVPGPKYHRLITTIFPRAALDRGPGGRVGWLFLARSFRSLPFPLERNMLAFIHLRHFTRSCPCFTPITNLFFYNYTAYTVSKAYWGGQTPGGKGRVITKLIRNGASVTGYKVGICLLSWFWLFLFYSCVAYTPSDCLCRYSSSLHCVDFFRGSFR